MLTTILTPAEPRATSGTSCFLWRGLPTLGALKRRLVDEIECMDDPGFFQTVAQIDPVFTLRLTAEHLNVVPDCDSVAPHTAEMLLRIGRDRLRRLIRSFPSLETGDNLLGTQAGRLWMHSAGAARLAELLANVTGVAPEVAGLAGLLHDIGRVPLLLETSDRNPASPRVRAEGMFDHGVFGAMIAEAHGVHPVVCRIIRDSQSARVQPSLPVDVRVVMVAQRFAEMAGYGPVPLPRTSSGVALAWLQSCLPELEQEFLPELCKTMEEILAETFIRMTGLCSAAEPVAADCR